MSGTVGEPGTIQEISSRTMQPKPPLDVLPTVTSAESDSEKPIGIISGADFAELVFENMGKLTDADLWTLGLRRQLTSR